MSSVLLLQICLITTCSNTLLNDYNHVNGVARSLHVRRPNTWRPRHRRANSAPASPFRRRRRPLANNQLVPVSNRRELQVFPRPFAWTIMASVKIRPGPSDQSTSLDAIFATSSSIMQDLDSTAIARVEPAPGPAPIPSAHVGKADDFQEDRQTDFSLQPWTSSAPPLSTTSETFDTRSTRSSSSASRNANRLSLTLPIALPNSTPSRPTPGSIPPTPSESVGSGMNSPVDPNDFIIAIAAQERRVLELREELDRAERELKTLRSKWKTTEVHKVKASVRKNEPLRVMVPPSSEGEGSKDSPAVRHSLDVERKKALLLGQGNLRQTKRKVMRGGHTRALSLLSPTKTENDISIHQDHDTLRSPDSFFQSTQDFVPAPLNKRATWAPRQTQQPHAVKQIAQDFRHGLWTFVEDLRQATVGDEGISATSNRTSEFQSGANRSCTDQDTIRASTANRGRIPFPMEPSSQEDTSSRPSSASFQDRAQQHQRSVSRPDPKPRKHFSWTPLTSDDMGDDDWSNWDSPTVKTSRWSGSTVNGDIIPAIPERVDENETTLRRKRSRSELRASSPLTPGTLGELPSALLNSLTPSNIKRFSSDFMKEWEKSLSPPAETSTFEPSFQSIKDNSP
ncbi:hypothetical protein BJ170DRAFT_599508 [Xylariales sp. AK1849]|nr:hypothetical protein BJ170DRAFT_599508 [Xylariales sp. AK1849]